MVIFKKDRYDLGVVFGLVMPVLSFFGYYYWKFSLFTFAEFMTMLKENKQLVTALSMPCLLLNVVLFTIYINGQQDKTAKGIFFVTVIYAAAALLFKIMG